MIYFDNAATGGKKPDSVIRGMAEAVRGLSVNPGRGGYELSMKASEIVYNTRRRIADFFGCEDETNVAFTPGCTASLNMAIKGSASYGDHIIMSSLEHNSVLRPVYSLKKNLNCDYSIATVDFSQPNSTVTSFENKIKENTKIIVCTHASNVTGEVLPICEIGEICKARGIIFIVDAAQSAGVLPINVKEMNIDYLCLAPHKGLMSPMGIGVLVAAKPPKSTIIEGGTGIDSNNPEQLPIMPEMLESGTLNLPGIVGLANGLKFLRDAGMYKIYKHEMKIIEYLYKRLMALGCIIYSKSPVLYANVPVLSFNIPGVSSSAVAGILSKNGIAVRAGLHCAPLAHDRLGTLESGTVRISIGYQNTQQEADKFIEVIKKIILSKKR